MAADSRILVARGARSSRCISGLADKEPILAMWCDCGIAHSTITADKKSWRDCHFRRTHYADTPDSCRAQTRFQPPDQCLGQRGPDPQWWCYEL